MKRYQEKDNTKIAPNLSLILNFGAFISIFLLNFSYRNVIKVFVEVGLVDSFHENFSIVYFICKSRL